MMWSRRKLASAAKKVAAASPMAHPVRSATVTISGAETRASRSASSPARPAGGTASGKSPRALLAAGAQGRGDPGIGQIPSALAGRGLQVRRQCGGEPGNDLADRRAETPDDRFQTVL